MCDGTHAFQTLSVFSPYTLWILRQFWLIGFQLAFPSSNNHILSLVQDCPQLTGCCFACVLGDYGCLGLRPPWKQTCNSWVKGWEAEPFQSPFSIKWWLNALNAVLEPPTGLPWSDPWWLLNTAPMVGLFPSQPQFPTPPLDFPESIFTWI